MRRLMQEAIKDALILSTLVILPMTFLGPGWTADDASNNHQNNRNNKNGISIRECFARQHLPREEDEKKKQEGW
jgi:hypothetical protein